ncbi:hypothetical protein GCM10022225_26660 [Plantactinospora mayteni]|uniref:Uncharacterized protein n=1 Tax=Plantactinospora mayteni TaxID=566021 RepID=A0ABQ4EIR4_9ACTN|nr:hypothetical protein [Plantactinospora mayteni]GIG94604.1 hypothetical protein Pma05_11770 [Plantactinospora mayteni]
MTLYSVNCDQRFRFPVLATFLTPNGYPATVTVTTVTDFGLATDLVARLNRISACAAEPVVRTTEPTGNPRQAHEKFPDLHLRVFLDDAAGQQLTGGFFHSLWYSYITAVLTYELGGINGVLDLLPERAAAGVSEELGEEVRSLLNLHAGRPADRVFRGSGPDPRPLGLIGPGLAVHSDDVQALRKAQIALGPKRAAEVSRHLWQLAHMAVYLGVDLDPIGRTFEVGGGPEYHFHSAQVQAPAKTGETWQLTVRSPERLAVVCEIPDPLDDEELVNHLVKACEAEGGLMSQWSLAKVGFRLYGTPYVVVRQAFGQP